jgi:hypothetical protein
LGMPQWLTSTCVMPSHGSLERLALINTLLKGRPHHIDQIMCHSAIFATVGVGLATAWALSQALPEMNRDANARLIPDFDPPRPYLSSGKPPVAARLFKWTSRQGTYHNGQGWRAWPTTRSRYVHPAIASDIPHASKVDASWSYRCLMRWLSSQATPSVISPLLFCSLCDQVVQKPVRAGKYAGTSASKTPCSS